MPNNTRKHRRPFLPMPGSTGRGRADDDWWFWSQPVLHVTALPSVDPSAQGFVLYDGDGNVVERKIGFKTGGDS